MILILLQIGRKRGNLGGWGQQILTTVDFRPRVRIKILWPSSWWNLREFASSWLTVTCDIEFVSTSQPQHLGKPQSCNVLHSLGIVTNKPLLLRNLDQELNHTPSWVFCRWHMASLCDLTALQEQAALVGAVLDLKDVPHHLLGTYLPNPDLTIQEFVRGCFSRWHHKIYDDREHPRFGYRQAWWRELLSIQIWDSRGVQSGGAGGFWTRETEA